MSDDFDDIRQALLEQRQAALVSAGALSEDTRTLEASQSAAENKVRGMEDGDTLSVELGVMAQLSSANRELLVEVDAALTAIEQGRYGQCTGCGVQIPRGRLEARPRSMSCVACASARR